MCLEPETEWGLPGQEEEGREEASLREGALPPRLREGHLCLSQCV